MTAIDDPDIGQWEDEGSISSKSGLGITEFYFWAVDIAKPRYRSGRGLLRGGEAALEMLRVRRWPYSSVPRLCRQESREL
jgi:hypothetical protein